MKALLIAVAILAIARPAFANPEVVAATLATEEQECRYLINLCKVANSVALAAQAARTAKVIRAKHEKAPACLADCLNDYGQILDMNSPVWK